MTCARIIGAASLLLLVGFGLWQLHHSGYVAGRNAVQVAWDADRLRMAETEHAAQLAYEERMQHAQQQHDLDQARIERLHAAAGRVRIHLPTCPPRPDDTAATDGGARLLSERVDRRLAEFQARVGRLIARCDQLNIDAIRANEPRNPE